VHALPVSRAHEDVYTAEGMAAKASWKSEFAAVTDVELTGGNLL